MPVPEPGSMICADGCSWSLSPKKPLAAKDTSRNGLVFNNEHKRGYSKSFLIHNLSLHMVQRLLLLSSVSLLNMLKCVFLTFFDIFLLVFYLFRSFPNRQLVNWLRWQMLRTDALAPLWGHWLLAQHVAPENPQNRGPKSLQKKQKQKRESPFLILWSQKKICTFRLSVALEGQGFQGKCHVNAYAFSPPYATHSFFALPVHAFANQRRSGGATSLSPARHQLDGYRLSGRDLRNFKQNT